MNPLTRRNQSTPTPAPAEVAPAPAMRTPQSERQRLQLEIDRIDTVPARQAARAQWGSILNELTHPIKIIVRSRPLSSLPVVTALLEDSRLAARLLGEWLEDQLAVATLVERDRLLVIPATDEAELQFRTDAMEKALRRARLEGVRIPPEDVPMLRTLSYNPRATEPQPIPETMQEGWTEVNADGWWTRAYDMGQLPPSILTNWASPLLAGDETIDVAIDIEPQDINYVKTWVLDVKIRRLLSSTPSIERQVALEQLQGLRNAFERRRVAPFEVGVTVLVRGTSQQDVRARSRRVEDRVRGTGARLNVLRWEQAAGLQQLDPARTKPLRGRTHLVETGTLARTYPWSDGYLQLPDGVPWGEAGARPCLFTPFVATNRGPHMAWYGTTNAGTGMAAHLLWSRLHLIQGVRIFGIDQDEQHEHCGRFLEYLGGRKLAPRDARDAADIVLHAADGVVILDLSDVDEDKVGATLRGLVKGGQVAYADLPWSFDRVRRRGGDCLGGSRGRAGATRWREPVAALGAESERDHPAAIDLVWYGRRARHSGQQRRVVVRGTAAARTRRGVGCARAHRRRTAVGAHRGYRHWTAGLRWPACLARPVRQVVAERVRRLPQ
jgi:hypothetical protein